MSCPARGMGVEIQCRCCQMADRYVMPREGHGVETINVKRDKHVYTYYESVRDSKNLLL